MKRTIFSALITILVLSGCGSQSVEEKKQENKGIGPFDKVILGSINPTLAERGEQKFNQVCATCHKASEEHIGPPMVGLMKKRTPEWILNMIINPVEMTAKDPDAKALFEKYKVPMPDPGISQDDARDILEYIRTLN